MQRNTDYIELKTVAVNRAEIILPISKMPSFLLESVNNEFHRRDDHYDEAYLVLPWSAQKEGVVELVKLVFEFSGAIPDFRAWVENSTMEFGIIFSYVTTARRGSVRQLKTPNPNANKWFNKQWPVASNYPSNLVQAFNLLSKERVGPTRLEVNCSLPTDDLGFLWSHFLEIFPAIRLNEVAQGYEHTIDSATGKEMNLTTARLLFDISAVHENKYHSIFENIELVHSLISPVMRIFTDSPMLQTNQPRWGL